jgi:uncharacterized protein YbbK (DUF523 family)
MILGVSSCLLGNMCRYDGVIEHSFPFGQAQHPKLWDYADNIDTLLFLNNLQ